MYINVKFLHPKDQPVRFDVTSFADVGDLKYLLLMDGSSPFKGRHNDIFIVQSGKQAEAGGLDEGVALEEEATYYAVLSIDRYSGSWINLGL